jgi:hypothetical protein
MSTNVFGQRSVIFITIAAVLVKFSLIIGIFAVTKVAKSQNADELVRSKDYRRISNASGTCLTIKGAKNIVIEKLRIGPCAKDGLYLVSSKNVVVRNLFIKGTKGNGITVEASSSILIEGNVIEDTATSVYALKSIDVRVINNSFENVLGPLPRGQFVQFDKVSGTANRIACNFGKNIKGRSAPEDAISIYNSSGEIDHPIRIEKNIIIGGGPSLSGGGIMLGDGGGQNIVAEENVLIDPGQYGIAAAGGINLSILNNEVYGHMQQFTNVGIYVWNQSNKPCDQVTVRGNRVRWTNESGKPNPWWNGRNCGGLKIGENDFRGADLFDPPDALTLKSLCSRN